MGAIAVADGEQAQVNEMLCIGCGVCTPSCPIEAVDLVLRGEVRKPPELSEILTRRYKVAP